MGTALFRAAGTMSKVSKLVGIQKSLGITLIELMIVVAIVAIIASIAYPSYQSHTVKTRRVEAQTMLLEIMQRQRQYFSQENTYTTDLIGDLGYANAGSGEVATENGFYLISATACPAETIVECVLLTAEAQAGQVNDSDLSYNSRNEKTPAEKW